MLHIIITSLLVLLILYIGYGIRLFFGITSDVEVEGEDYEEDKCWCAGGVKFEKSYCVVHRYDCPLYKKN